MSAGLCGNPSFHGIEAEVSPVLGQTTWDTVMLWGGVRGSASMPICPLQFKVQTGGTMEFKQSGMYTLIQFSSLLLLIS